MLLQRLEPQLEVNQRSSEAPLVGMIALRAFQLPTSHASDGAGLMCQDPREGTFLSDIYTRVDNHQVVVDVSNRHHCKQLS